MGFSNSASKMFGIIAKYKFPKIIQKNINKAYVNAFNINMSEFKPLEEYESLNALFTRTLLNERELEDGFISPSDGKILELGSSFQNDLKENLAFSIKGSSYSIEELLKNSASKEELENGIDYANIYLSPKDYHHYHAPCNMQILSATYMSGALFSVSEAKLAKIINLYTKNERVVLKCLVEGKFILWMVFVGALNVGKMHFSFDTSIQTNAANFDFTHTYEDLFVKKGQRLGNFELGSTIVLIAQKGFLKFSKNAYEQVEFSKKIADFA
ncbi:phosphatidylserine decarboxylase [Campylobacter lari]|uniref:phosphatidylserine decarboxylase n=1 Tax=Campylobacter lari TaxID=201 RepID=A0A5L8X965_CAMLA|nr:MULTISPECIES: phosphatidylserine decarboxylase [Campylobacter]MCR8708274.1 phosphatidylserine decarboxylase [Campylobacter sp. RM5063]EAI3905758.1 phosphatidylserine decarboxylase [Campylobacter lari]EAI3914266.1 phosphatidylserine decarboxylase [Campylobacter lari]EAI4449255.1 phosphatidylserine decarboxylase [Campylobacter lari]EAI8629582.1 phosphatidylserine decarboxylase [Campylobacter lari]